MPGHFVIAFIDDHLATRQLLVAIGDATIHR
jgi:hypothetical protein